MFLLDMLTFATVGSGKSRIAGSREIKENHNASDEAERTPANLSVFPLQLIQRKSISLP
jgi:hypothetical protein